MAVRNLDYIKSNDPRLYEALHDIIRQQSTIAEQVNGNVSGQPMAPPSIGGIQVSAKNGHFQVAIQDTGPIYRDVHYYIEHADNPSFQNAHVIHNGHSRNWGGFMGNVTRYFRAYSSYSSSAPGSPAYHGGSLNPQPVHGGGIIGGPSFLNTQSSGTGFPGQGMSGPGPVPFRAVDGRPPVRGETTGTGASAKGQSGSFDSGGLPPTGGSSFVAPAGGGGSSSGNIPTVSTTQSGLAALAATLTSSSQLIVYVTDYIHQLQWTGSGWDWGPIGDQGVGNVELKTAAPAGSSAVGYQLCDGSITTKLNSDGTVTSVTTIDFSVTHVFPKLGTTYGNFVNAPIAPGFTGTPATIPATATAAINVTPSGATQVSAETHTHAYTPAGTIDSTAQPFRIVYAAYFRR